jgi:hypothetical protein
LFCNANFLLVTKQFQLNFILSHVTFMSSWSVRHYKRYPVLARHLALKTHTHTHTHTHTYKTCQLVKVYGLYSLYMLAKFERVGERERERETERPRGRVMRFINYISNKLKSW